MIEIITERGEKYTIDRDTERVFKDGYLLPSSEIELIYSNLGGPDAIPSVSGLWIKKTNSILGLSGKYNPVTDSNTIF